MSGSSKLPPSREDRSFFRLLSSTMASAILAKGVALAMAILLARALGPEAFGVFIFAQGVGLIAGRLSTLGWPTLMTRQIPVFLDKGQSGLLKGIVHAGTWVVVGSSLLVAILLSGGSALLNVAGGDGTIARGLLLAAVLCPVFACRRLYRQQLSALKMPALAVILDEVLAPLAVVAVVFLPDLTAVKANLAYAVAGMLGVLIAHLFVRRDLRPALSDAQPQYELSPWMKTSLFLVAAASAKLLMNKTDVVMLAPLSGFEQTGLYGTAFRLTYAITFPQVALSLVMSPRLARAFAARDLPRLKSEMKKAYLFTFATTILTVAPLVLLPTVTLSLIFGAEFVAATPVLIVLALGQAVAALGLPLAALASMTSKERALAATTWLALLLNLVLNALLIPQFGAVGAAYASLVGVAALVVGTIIYVLLPILNPALYQASDHV